MSVQAYATSGNSALSRRHTERKHRAVMRLIHQEGRDDLIEGRLFEPFSRYDRWKRLLNTFQRGPHSRFMIQRVKRKEYAALQRWAAALAAIYDELAAINTDLHRHAA